MKDFKIIFSLFAVIFLLFSCQSTIDDSLIESEIVDGVVLDRTDDPNSPPPYMDGDACDCFVVISDVSSPDPGYYVSVEEQTEEACGDCSFYYSHAADVCPLDVENCRDNLASPLGAHPFNCTVNEGQTLNIIALAYEQNEPNCGLIPNPEVTLTYYIMCVDKERDFGGACPGQYYITPPQTVSGAARIKVEIQDADCDCKPVII